MRTYSQSLNTVGVGPEVSGYVKGVTEYIEGDTGADLTGFDVDAVIGAAWESVGPTGSGATNIWTDMDIIPSGAKWIELKIYNQPANTGGTPCYQILYGRKTGSSAATGIGTRIAQAYVGSGGASSTDAGNVTTIKLPLDTSGRFDLYLSSNGTTFISNIYVVGFGI